MESSKEYVPKKKKVMIRKKNVLETLEGIMSANQPTNENKILLDNNFDNNQSLNLDDIIKQFDIKAEQP
jgi:hypothetical protein